MSERMLEGVSERVSKHIRKNARRYVKKNVGIHMRKNVRSMSEVGRMSEDIKTYGRNNIMLEIMLEDVSEIM